MHGSHPNVSSPSSTLVILGCKTTKFSVMLDSLKSQEDYTKATTTKTFSQNIMPLYYRGYGLLLLMYL